jgi:hypothetical protein
VTISPTRLNFRRETQLTRWVCGIFLGREFHARVWELQLQAIARHDETVQLWSLFHTVAPRCTRSGTKVLVELSMLLYETSLSKVCRMI